MANLQDQEFTTDVTLQNVEAAFRKGGSVNKVISCHLIKMVSF